MSRRSYYKPAPPEAAAGGSDAPLSVSEVSRRITRLLEEGVGQVWVAGEVSNLRVPASGHAYFVLKDEGAALNAVCFRSSLAKLRVEIENGKKLEVYGRVTAYSARSEYQIIIERAREAGLGDLMRRYLELRDRLKAEGLFDAERKRPIPRLPRTIGIVTSSTGAALRDMLNVLGRRASGLTILLAPASVQGAAAAGEIARALRLIERDGRAEVVICGRGGGSIEDLWAFNEEPVVRAIAACKIPVISAVGHETDTTLADFAADLRAPTPSAAAELVTQHYEELRRSVARQTATLARSMLRRLERQRARLEALADSWALRRPAEMLNSARQRVDDLKDEMDRAMQAGLALRRAALAERLHRLELASPSKRLAETQLKLAAARAEGRQLDLRLRAAVRGRVKNSRLRLDSMRSRLAALGPGSVLNRGYSFITTPNGRRIITGPGQSKPNQALKVHSKGGEWRVAALPEGDELFDTIG